MTDAIDAILNPPATPPTHSYYPEGHTPIGARGLKNAKIVIVGEAPGEEEVRQGKPFVGASGKELDKMLVDAGIDPATCYYTNVTLIRPKGNDIETWVHKSAKPKKRGKKVTPETWVPYRGWMVEPHVMEDAKRLVDELKSIKPNVVISVGHTPFWALCKEGARGKVGTWRGSTLISDIVPGLKVLVAYHPSFILRAWQHRRITVQDFRRALHASRRPELDVPAWDFTIAPTYEQTCDWLVGVLRELDQRPVKMMCDVEVSQMKTLCVGIATSRLRAICIPFLHKFDWYFTKEQHYVVCRLLHKVLTHVNALVKNQNIGFDTQFLVNDFLLYPRIVGDTMVNQNVLYPGTPMNVAYQASMYCELYRYWKDDGKFWKLKEIRNWDQLWFYNCEDCARTYEVDDAQEAFLVQRKLLPQRSFLQDKIHPLLMRAMFRGVRVDLKLKDAMLGELVMVSMAAQAKVNELATRQLDISSPTQLAHFFYHELRMKPILNAEGNPTCDADALVELAHQDPLVGELVRWINLARSYIAAITVCKAKTEKDGRWRSSYSLGLVETYRLSSSKNPFGRGLNLMNISAGKDVKDADDD